MLRILEGKPATERARTANALDRASSLVAVRFRCPPPCYDLRMQPNTRKQIKWGLVVVGLFGAMLAYALKFGMPF